MGKKTMKIDLERVVYTVQHLQSWIGIICSNCRDLQGTRGVQGRTMEEQAAPGEKLQRGTAKGAFTCANNLVIDLIGKA